MAHRIEDGQRAERMTARDSLGLGGVPETMLMPLWNRAADAGSSAPLLRDPMAVALVQRIDYDFRGKFGRPQATHAIRARFTDEMIGDFMRRHPDATVVALGEGLETQLWRIDDGRVDWLTVDLPVAIQARERMLPAHPRNRRLACSALDAAWLDAVPADHPVFISAAGLFMYFQEAEVAGLLRQIVRRFPAGEIFFDTIPPWFSRKTLRGWAVTPRYTAPPMPFGLPLGRLDAWVRDIGGLGILRAVTYAEPYPERMRVFALLSRLRYVRNNIAPGLVQLRLGQ